MLSSVHYIQLAFYIKTKTITLGWFLFLIFFISIQSHAQNSARGGKNADSIIVVAPNDSIFKNPNAQKESSKTDSILIVKTQKEAKKNNKVDTTPQLHSPKKAAIMSAILPGTGQIYNRKYWKAPLIYATGGALGYFLVYNAKNYNIYKKAYIYRKDSDPSTVDVFQNYSEEWIKSERDRNLKNLEYTYIFTTFWYILNIVDASVDAHFFYFDVNDNLSMSIEPVVIPNYQFGLKNYSSLKLTLRF